jgi:hypothetical protein
LASLSVALNGLLIGLLTNNTSVIPKFTVKRLETSTNHLSDLS